MRLPRSRESCAFASVGGPASSYGGLRRKVVTATLRRMAVVEGRSSQLLRGVLDLLPRIPASQSTLLAVYTNATPTGPYRGAGRPEAAFLIERMMDRLAVELDLDPVEVRLRNFIRPSDFPYTNAAGSTYDSGDYQASLERLIELADYPGLRRAQTAARQEGRLQGIGISTYVEEAAGFAEDRATARLELDGTITVITGSTPHGQGHQTTWAQLAAEAFGVPFEQVRVLYGDTDQPAYAVGTFGSRSAAISGAAVQRAPSGSSERSERWRPPRSKRRPATSW